MGTVIKTQKTELYWASAPTVATRAVALTSIGGLGGARDPIETTDLDALTDKTFFAGLATPGVVTLAFNVQKGELSHKALIALRDSGAEVSWGIYSSDAATAPAVVASLVQKVVGRVSARFLGYVSDVAVDISGNTIWKGTISIQRSGPIDWDLN